MLASTSPRDFKLCQSASPRSLSTVFHVRTCASVGWLTCPVLAALSLSIGSYRIWVFGNQRCSGKRFIVSGFQKPPLSQLGMSSLGLGSFNLISLAASRLLNTRWRKASARDISSSHPKPVPSLVSRCLFLKDTGSSNHHTSILFHHQRLSLEQSYDTSLSLLRVPRSSLLMTHIPHQARNYQ